MFENMLHEPALLGLLAGIVTWLFTAAGAAAVFLRHSFSRRLLDILLGFAAGVMLAASVWSLLIPALDVAEETWGHWRFVPAAIGLFAGALGLRFLDAILPHLHPVASLQDGTSSGKASKHMLLALAITLHNIPEALAVGVAFGAVALDPTLGLAGAITLMLGIGLQNLPEGMAVSIPLMREGMPKWKAFMIGQFSGLVEPVAALLGAVLASATMPVLPWAMSFAAGAMIFVTIEEVLPEAQGDGNGDAATLGAMLGFATMMCLDVAFG